MNLQSEAREAFQQLSTAGNDQATLSYCRHVRHGCCIGSAQPNPSTRLKPVNCDDGFRFGETKSILSQSQNRTRARAIVEVIFDSLCDATRDEDHFDETSRAATSTTYRMRCLSTTSRIF